MNDDNTRHPMYQVSQGDPERFTRWEAWVGVLVVAMVALAAGIWAGLVVATTLDSQPAPVCHAVSEHGDMLDCEYHNGAWWPTDNVNTHTGQETNP